MAGISAALAPGAAAVEIAPGVDWTTVVRDRGPVRINVLEVAATRVRGVLSNERIARRERVSAMARRVGAVAAVNGGSSTASGDPVGALAFDGELLSEPVAGRSALILGAEPRTAPLRFRGRVTVNGRTRIIDGVNRTRGLIPACGGRGGDLPTMRPNAARTCVDASELVLLTSRYGALPPREGGVEAVIRDGTVTDLRPPGSGRVPDGSVLLTGTGDAASFLRDAAPPRSRADISLELRAGDVPVAAPALVVGAGPRLVRAGRVAVSARAEGFAPVEAPAFFRSFVAGRQSRTLAGLRPDGTLLLVTVDGGRPAWSAGMTLFEAARLMRSLGVHDALNLDGGASSTMVVHGEVVNRPSSRVGERRVGNALYVSP